MSVNRRDLLLGSLPLAAGATLANSDEATATKPIKLASLSFTATGLVPNLKADQTAKLQAAIDLAAKKKMKLTLPGGRYITGPLVLRSGSHIEGVYGETVLQFSKGASFISAKGLSSVTLQYLVFDGASRGFIGSSVNGLLSFDTIPNLLIEHCFIKDGLLNGLSLQNCGGHIHANKISLCGSAGIFATDSSQLEISHNQVTDCSNNGILVWRSKKGTDGTIVSQNHIHRIKTKDGGSGQNGNGVNVYRAGNVIVSNNVISDCAFSAVRGNAADNIQILNNSCSKLGEVALYSEFGFEGTIISNNMVDDAHVGISITNFNEGGRLATATGNLIRNLKKYKGNAAIGIAVEADTMVTGNVVENVPGLGISLGYGKYMRQVTVNNNLVRDAQIGIGVSTHTEAGYALIATNMITGAKKGGVRAMDLEKPIGPDLTKSSSEAFLNLAVYGNVSL